MITNETGLYLATVETLDQILADSHRISAAAYYEAGVKPDTDFGVEGMPDWLLLQRPSVIYEKPWVRQVVLRQRGGVEIVHDFDCAWDDTEAIVAAGAQAYYRHRELTHRSYFEESNYKMPLITYLLGDITLRDIQDSLHDFVRREKLAV